MLSEAGKKSINHSVSESSTSLHKLCVTSQPLTLENITRVQWLYGQQPGSQAVTYRGFFSRTHWICYCAVSQLCILSGFLLADLPFLFAVLSLPCGVCDTFPSCALSYEGHHNRCSRFHRVLQQRGSVCVCACMSVCKMTSQSSRATPYNTTAVTKD